MIVGRVSIAPMMRWTNQHFRVLMRMISPDLLLYTEMVTTGAILHGPKDRLLRYHLSEHPLALQLGGSEPDALAQCAQIGEAAGFDEVNLNIGCPSERVQSGSFGACLMREPVLVANCVREMMQATGLPVSVKCRIGVDDQEIDTTFPHFIDTVAEAGCQHFIVHARKAWLKGLNPKQNRDVPPLDYQRIWDCKQDRPELEIIINGGVKTVGHVAEHLSHVDGVMLGRVAYEDTYQIARICEAVFGKPAKSRMEIAKAYFDYCTEQVALGEPVSALLRPIFNLWKGESGAKIIRQKLTQACQQGRLLDLCDLVDAGNPFKIAS